TLSATRWAQGGSKGQSLAAATREGRSTVVILLPTLTDEQLALRDAVARLLDKRASAEQVRAAEPLGFDQRVWDGLLELGLLEAAASGHATFADLAVVAELWGARLAPAPFVEAAVAARLLGRTEAG